LTDSKEPLSTILEKDLLKTEMRQVTNIVVTSHLTLDFARRLEYLVAQQQTYMIFVIKNDNGKISKEENVLIERLKKRHINVKVVRSQVADKGFKEVSSS
jgi:predicted anti-sigma-YlaC factor YlaD